MHFNLFEPKILPLSEVVEDRNYEFPTFQRDFVWQPKQIKALIDSVYNGIPINSIYLWNSIGVITKSGEESESETKLVIDGQQRLTALRAVLLGEMYLNKQKVWKRVQFAFNPIKGTFRQVDSKFTPGDRFIKNVAHFYAEPKAETTAYLHRNKGGFTKPQLDAIDENLNRLAQIKHYPVVIYDINDKVDLDQAFQCFERTNQGGTRVSKANLCMAWLETYQPLLAEGIIHFAEGIQFGKVKEPRTETRRFRKSVFYEKLDWIKLEYDRKAFYQPNTEQIVELLFNVIQGGNRFRLDTIARELLGNESSYVGNNDSSNETTNKAESAFMSLVDKNNYNRFDALISRFPGITKTDQDYAYWLYLQHVAEGKRKEEIAPLIQRWYLLNLMSNIRTSGKAAFSTYMNGFLQHGGLEGYLETLEAELNTESWEKTLPVKLKGALNKKAQKQIITAWEFTQVLEGQTALFDGSMPIEKLREQKKVRSEHHIYPQNVLREKVPQEQIDAVANIALTTSDVNSSIGDRPMHVYINEENREGRLRNAADHLKTHCIPDEAGILDYADFLEARATLMARRFKEVYLALKG